MAAGYDVNLNIALKNSNKLMQLRKELKAVGEAQVRFNKAASEGNGIAVATFNKLNKQLSKAKGLLNKAAYGTDSFKRAARALVNVEKEHNHQLKEKEKLLNKLRMESDPLFQLKQQRKQQIKENIRQNRALRFTNVNPGRPAVVGDYGQVGGRIGPAQVLANSQGGFLAFSKIAEKIETGVKGIAKSSSQTARVLSSQAASAAFQDLPFGVKGGQIGPRQASLFNRLGFGKGASPRGPFAMQGGAGSRVKSSLQSGLIGGGFPLLFGGGGASAVAGGLGGLAGGALSAGGGFALSIAATAAVSKIQEVRNFRKEVKDLNEDLEALGAKTLFSRKELKQLGKDLDITTNEALELAIQFKKFEGELGTKLSKIFGSREIFDATVGLKDFESVLARIKILGEELTLEKEFEAYSILSKDGAEAASDFITNLFIANKQRQLFQDRFKNDVKTLLRSGIEGVSTDPYSNLRPVSEDFAKNINQIMATNVEIQQIMNDPKYLLSRGGLTAEGFEKVNAILKDILSNNDKLRAALKLLPDDFDLSTASVEKIVERLSEATEKLQFLQEFKAPEEEIRKLLNPMRQVLDLSNEIKIGFEDSFKGIIKGTMSVQDAFRSMLNRIADYFLDFAARLLALQVQKGFLSLFSSMFEVGDTGLTKGDPMLGSRYLSGRKRANGGIVDAGKSYMVGERGAEMFVPNAGGRIVSNSDLGGSTNIVVNVDASGSSVEGDEEQGRELGRMISVAIQSELIKQKRPGGMLA